MPVGGISLPATNLYPPYLWVWVQVTLGIPQGYPCHSLSSTGYWSEDGDGTPPPSPSMHRNMKDMPLCGLSFMFRGHPSLYCDNDDGTPPPSSLMQRKPFQGLSMHRNLSKHKRHALVACLLCFEGIHSPTATTTTTHPAQPDVRSEVFLLYISNIVS